MGERRTHTHTHLCQIHLIGQPLILFCSHPEALRLGVYHRQAQFVPLRGRTRFACGLTGWQQFSARRLPDGASVGGTSARPAVLTRSPGADIWGPC